MSYDLMVFDPGVAPLDRPGFMIWYENLTEWDEGHGYDDPVVSTPALRSWFLEMIREYPAMNGPYAVDDVDNPKLTDYSVGQTAIYACFAWSECENAYRAMITLPRKHGVAFFDVSGSNGQVWVPGSNKDYVCVLDG